MGQNFNEASKRKKEEQISVPILEKLQRVIKNQK